RNPATTSGQPNGENASRTLEGNGPNALARLRGTDVTLAAAARSSGGTTAITYELRVGTSIWDRALRINSSARASGRVGMNGTSARKTLDGRWVNTMVLTSPNRAANGTAAT